MVVKERICPTCGGEFSSESAMKIHHTKAHDESITGHEIDCDVCGDSFTKVPSMIERDDNHYCSKPCRLDGQSTSKEEILEKFYKLKEELNTVPKRDDIRGKTGFDLKVVSKYFGSWNDLLKEAGYKIHEPWKLPEEEREIRYYGPNWDEQAAKARQRDGYECVICGYSNETSKDEQGRALPVHHIEWDSSKTYKERNKLSNLVSLCHSCHAQVESWPVEPEYSIGTSMAN